MPEERQREIVVLNRIYDLYDTVVAAFGPACKKYCADCCTCNVTLTTLEAAPIIGYLRESGGWDWQGDTQAVYDGPRFRPKITTNRLAELCLSGEEIPEEDNDPAWGRCLFLRDDACRIYAVRPFGCRCLLSRKTCAVVGAAEITPYLLTVNSVFLQAIEHLDQNGFSGNMSDVLRWMGEAEKDLIIESEREDAKKRGLIPNRPLTGFMVPMEHRQEISGIVTRLRNLSAGPDDLFG